MTQRIFLSPPHLAGNEQRYVQEAFASNYVAPVGPMLERFEDAMAEYTGISHCVALSSGTAALHLALRVLGIAQGDIVWAPSFTFIGGIAPIIQIGASVVFVDSDPEFWTIDTNLLEKELAHAKKNNALPKALITADIYGQSADYNALRQLCDTYGIMLIADCAESVGTLYQGNHAGQLADIAIFSFNGNKIITSSGGGMLATNRKDWAEHTRKLATQAREPALHYEHQELGYNYRLSNISAAIGLGQLEQIEEKVAARRNILQRYQAALAGMNGLSFIKERPNSRMNGWLSVLLLDPAYLPISPMELCRVLDKENIEARPAWKPMHLQPVFSGTARYGGAVCEHIFTQGICLPSGSGMSEAEQNKVIAVLKKALL